MKFMNTAKRFGSRVKTAVQQRGAQIAVLTAGATGGFAHADGLPSDVVSAIAAGVALALALGQGEIVNVL